MGFDEILEAGRRQDLQALLVALKSSCIDERQVGSLYCAVSVLAFEGDFAAVAFLIKQGAGIDLAVEGAARGGHRLYTEALLGRGADIDAAVVGAATAGHEIYAEELLQRGANMSYAAAGAARGGHKAYCEKLVARGADMNMMGFAAAFRVDKSYAEELFSRGANIEQVARGAAACGDRVYADKLIEHGAPLSEVGLGAGMSGQWAYAKELWLRGAPIDVVAQGATLYGHKVCAENLLLHGAHIDTLFMGAALGRHRSYVDELCDRGASIRCLVSCLGTTTTKALENNRYNQMRFLSFYPLSQIPQLVEAFKTAVAPIKVDPITEKRSIALSKNRQVGHLDYAQALARTAPECQGALFLLMILVLRKNTSLPHQAPPLFFDLWAHVFRFITPVPLNKSSLTQLGFVSGRTYLRAQLSTYQSSWGKNKPRARGFFKDLSQTGNLAEMQDLITKQTQVLQGNNPYPLIEWDKEYKSNRGRGAVDRFHGLIGLWEFMRTGEEVVFEEIEEAYWGCAIQ